MPTFFCQVDVLLNGDPVDGFPLQFTDVANTLTGFDVSFPAQAVNTSQPVVFNTLGSTYQAICARFFGARGRIALVGGTPENIMPTADPGGGFVGVGLKNAPGATLLDYVYAESAEVRAQGFVAFT